jgi:DNA-binding GntR family transcriptional regulator
MALIGACGLPRLLAFCTMLHDHFDRYRRLAVLRGGRHPLLKSNHAAIVDATLARESQKAEALLADHIRESTAQFASLLGADGLGKLSVSVE